jgi:hypothetical protein
MKRKIKDFFYWAFKAFVNDCSVGLFLITIGFIGGLCYNILWNFLKHLFVK